MATNANEPLVDPGNADSPVQPVTLQWQNVSYTVKEKKRGQPALDKPILRNISGYAAPKSFTVILGASGSGKTSLLSALADRLLASKSATLTGSMTVNGDQPPPDYRARCAYVQQTDVFYPQATVTEAVEMAARLRLGKNVSREAKLRRATEVIQMLGLVKAANTKVGDGARVKGISGGEMKRLGIACELVSSPSLVMLDEPTSGLDSHAALHVVRCLHELALTGRTVMASIHQPGSAIYALFGKLVVLAEGRTVYFGEASGVNGYFAEIGFSCPPMFNPADHMLQITSIDYTSEKSENESRAVLEQILQQVTTGDMMIRQTSSGLGQAIEAGTSYAEQFSLLYVRIAKQAIRNKVAMIIKLVQSLTTTLIMVGLYSNLDGGGVVSIGIANTTALLFFIVINGLFGPLFGTIQAFAPEVNIVLRERMNNLYAMAPYYLAKLLVALPFELIPLVMGNSVAYWALKFNHSGLRYLTFLLFTCGMSFSSIGIGFALAAASGGNVAASSAAVGPIAIILLLLGGFFINQATIPPWISWLSKVNYVNWSYHGLAINQFNGYTVKSPGAKLDANGRCAAGQSPQVCQDGDDILSQLLNNGEARSGSEWEETMWTQFGFICICIVFFNLLGYLALLMKGPKYLQMVRAADAPGISLPGVV